MRLGSSRLSWLAGGLALRFALLGWGMYQDAHSAVPYTDIDYSVFTSAAQHVAHSCPLDAIIAVPPQEEYEDLVNPPEAPGLCAQGYLSAAARFLLQMERELVDPELSAFGKDLDTADAKISLFVFSLFRPFFRVLAGLGNPFARPTYRYTPLLALVLAPGQYLAEPWRSLFGKVLFVLADVVIALLMWDIMDLRKRQRAGAESSGDEDNDNDDAASWLPGALWLLNPFPAQIATRGSSESLLGVLVLAFLDVTLRSSPEASLALPIVATKAAANGTDEDKVAPTPEEPTEALAPISLWSNSAIFAPFLFALAIHWKLYPVIYAASLVPHLASSARTRGSALSSSWSSVGAVARYGFVAVYSLIGFCGPVYLIWGDAYLNETILHHFHRSDHRHNFSPHFLGAYLSNVASIEGFLPSSLATAASPLAPILGFLPQLGLCAFIGFSLGGKDLIAACAAQTAAFVMLNKVSTSQYFTWFLWFLPIVAPSLEFASSAEAVVVGSVWVASQAAWLSQAYLLEFKAIDTYLSTYLTSLLLVVAHAWVLVRCFTAWGRSRQTQLRASMAATAAAAASSSGKKAS